MSRQRVIVGLGKVYVAEYPQQEQPAGLASAVCVSAVRLGQLGMCVTRLGQDRTGYACIDLLSASGVDVSHVQSDPDLPTGHVFVGAHRSSAPELDEQIACDNLQWDSDLSTAADDADAVFFSALAVRNVQAQSVIERFLAECPRSAIRVMDLTERPPEALNRVGLSRTMTYADVAIVDETAMDAILPATGAGEARLELMRREFKLSHVVALTDEKSAFRISVASEEAYCADGELPVEARWTALTALVYGLIWRWDMTQCLALARRAALFTAAHGDAPVPPDLLDAAGA